MENDVMESSVFPGERGGTVGVMSSRVGTDEDVGCFQQSELIRPRVEAIDAFLAFH